MDEVAKVISTPAILIKEPEHYFCDTIEEAVGLAQSLCKAPDRITGMECCTDILETRRRRMSGREPPGLHVVHNMPILPGDGTRQCTHSLMVWRPHGLDPVLLGTITLIANTTAYDVLPSAMKQELERWI